MIRQCCVCKKVHRRGRWVEPTPDDLQRMDISHGFCRECYESYRKTYLVPRPRSSSGDAALEYELELRGRSLTLES